MKKKLLIGLAALTAIAARADFDADVRQALQSAVADAQRAIQTAGIPAGMSISVLPLAGDRAEYVAGLIKNAATAAGLTYVEGKSDPFWDEVLREVEWDERKSDMLDADTLVKFGKLKASQALLYGVVREAARDGNRVFVELELHLSAIATKQHLWGGHFAKRHYLPGAMQGILDLNPAVRALLDKTVSRAAVSLKASPKLAAIKTVALTPLAGDMDGYVLHLAENALSQTALYPKALDVATLAEARGLLRDQPQQADALLFGAVRDLSRTLDRREFMRDIWRMDAEVQLTIQSAATGEVLWSATLRETGEDVDHTTWWELLTQHKIIVGYAAIGLVALLVFLRLIAAGTRVR